MNKTIQFVHTLEETGGIYFLMRNGGNLVCPYNSGACSSACPFFIIYDGVFQYNEDKSRELLNYRVELDCFHKSFTCNLETK